MRYKSLYILLPSSAKQQLEMTKFFVVWLTQSTTANFSHFYFEFRLPLHIYPGHLFRDLGSCEFRWWNINSFLTRRLPPYRCRRCLSSLTMQKRRRYSRLQSFLFCSRSPPYGHVCWPTLRRNDITMARYLALSIVSSPFLDVLLWFDPSPPRFLLSLHHAGVSTVRSSSLAFLLFHFLRLSLDPPIRCLSDPPIRCLSEIG